MGTLLDEKPSRKVAFFILLSERDIRIIPESARRQDHNKVCVPSGKGLDTV